jgi:gliding motility-associated-like protein
MVSLQSLGLARNQLTGSLPASIGNLVNLRGFSVFTNQLSGTVPASLGNLVNLTGLGLSVNQFSGDVPASIGLIPGLTDVSLRDNDFTSIPTFVSTAFTDLLVFGNKLHFGHLEPNIGKGGFVYAPQDNLPGGTATACEGSTLTINFSTPGTANVYQWYKDGVLIPGATSATFTKPNSTAADAGSYSVQVTNTIVTGLTLTSDPFVVTISTAPSAPVATGVTICSAAAATITASGGAAGQYRWYTAATGGTPLAGETNATFTTPALTANTDYFVAINDGSCESARTTVSVTVNAVPAAPTASAPAVCSGATATLTASGGSAGQYRWYTVATGGTPLAGETNATFTTPALTANTDYFVAINDGSCESARTAVTVTVNALPAKPTITASGPLAICANQSVTLTAPSGFTYLWSTGATTNQISVTTAGSYTVVVGNTAGCSSVASDPAVVTIISCTVNQPPAIAATTATAVINGIATIRLTDLISDPDNNLNFSSLRIVSPPLSGAQATIDSNFNLVLNYANVQFAGRDELVIEVCDQGGLCVQQRIFIEVAGDIVVFTGISPNGDGFNNTWIIQNIDTLPDTRENKVSIFNRWGDLIWSGNNYDNRNVVFTGVNNNGNEVTSGTYFYKIEFASGRETKTGFLSVKR